MNRDTTLGESHGARTSLHSSTVHCSPLAVAALPLASACWRERRKPPRSAVLSHVSLYSCPRLCLGDLPYPDGLMHQQLWSQRFIFDVLDLSFVDTAGH